MSSTNGTNAKQIMEKNRVLQAMYYDVINGKQKYQVREKFINNGYDNKTCSERQFYTYWNNMIDKFAEEFEANREALKSKFIARYLYLYELALKNNNIKEARGILDSIVKLTGAEEPIKQEIDLKNFTIDFGLDNIVKDDE